MARAATTSDAFNAVAEPRRREILDYLAMGERPVGDLVAKLGLEQPSVSKHLRVLRDVGLVRVRRHGRHMLYRTNAEAIRPLHEWTKTFERLWAHQLDADQGTGGGRAGERERKRIESERIRRLRDRGLKGAGAALRAYSTLNGVTMKNFLRRKHEQQSDDNGN